MQVVLIKYIIINFTFFINLAEVNGLVELTSVNDNVIINTEAAIRDKVNKLFHILKLKEINNKPKFKQYSMVHNSLVAITLRDNENLKTISKLVRVVNNIDNTTENFIAIINELLNAEENNQNLNENNENVDGYVIKYIDTFLSELKSLKEKFGVTSNKATLNINDELVKILTEDDNINVTSQNYSNITESSDILSENDFWQPSGRRIYQGKTVKIKNYPFMASIQIFHRFQCSGSIIKSDLIITAASCLQLAWNNRFFRENPAFLSVRVGSSFHNGGGEVVPVLEVNFHPNYDPKVLKHNLCLLRLIRHIKLKNRRVKRILFDSNPWSLPVNTYGITVLGWGAKRSNNIIDDTQSQLAFAELDVYPWSECAEVYSREYVTKKNFCGGFLSKGGGACNRDVGGPGVVEGVLTGVISFGSPLCGTPDAPTVFTKLGYYIDWIEDIMEQVVPHAKKRTTLLPVRTPFTFITRKPCTPFTVQPVTGTQTTPMEVVGIDDLQLSTREDSMFQEFLATMFGRDEDSDSEEVKDTKKDDKPAKTTQPWVEFATKIFDYETGQYDKEFTVLETNPRDSADTELERDIENLLFDINDVATDSDHANTGRKSKLDKKEIGGSLFENKTIDSKEESEENSESDDFKQSLLKHSNDNNSKSVNETVMTLLYMSDSEKNNNSVFKMNDQIDEEEVGMSIDSKPFKDLTFREDVQNTLYDSLPKELYKMFVVDVKHENKKK